MKYVNKESRKKIITLICILVAAIAVNMPVVYGDYLMGIRGLFVSFAYIGLALYWGMCILESVVGQASRRMMNFIVALMIFSLILRGAKFEIDYEAFEVPLWYMGYIPQVYLPLLVFYITVYIGKMEEKLGKWRLLMIPATLLVVGVLTNNFHNLAFHFYDGVTSNSKGYSRGIIYYLCLVWIIFFLLASIVNAARKSRLIGRKKIAVGMICWMMVPLLYLVYYQFGPFFTRTYIINFMESCCLLYMTFLEICIQTGMVPTNMAHEEVFEKSSISARIEDRDGHIMYVSETPVKLNGNMRRDLDAGHSVVVDKTYELRRDELRGGTVYWLNDVRELLTINAELENIKELLNEEHTILQAEIETREKITAAEEQNKIYEKVSWVLDPKIDELLADLDRIDDAVRGNNIGNAGGDNIGNAGGNNIGNATNVTRLLNLICIKGAYIKRRGNLVVISEQEKIINFKELGLCINESISYLRLLGCVCNCTLSGDGNVNENEMVAIYDLFENVVENSFPDIQAMMCMVSLKEDEITIKMQIETEKLPLSDEWILDNQKRYGGRIKQEIQDETIFIQATVARSRLMN